MKTIKIKLTGVICLFLMLHSFSLMAQKSDNFDFSTAAEEYVTKLSLDVQLTEIQKEKLKTNVNDYFSKINKAAKISDKAKYDNEVMVIKQLFQQQTDSILTDSQKKEIEQKNESRAEASVAKEKNTNKK